MNREIPTDFTGTIYTLKKKKKPTQPCCWTSLKAQKQQKLPFIKINYYIVYTNYYIVHTKWEDLSCATITI